MREGAQGGCSVVRVAVVALGVAYVTSYAAVRQAHRLIHYRSCPPPYDDRIDLPDPGIPMPWVSPESGSWSWGAYVYMAPALFFRPLMWIEQGCWWAASGWRSSC